MNNHFEASSDKYGAIDHVGAYASAVLNGGIVAGPHVRNACLRHINDLAFGEARGWYFDVAEAQRAIAFFPQWYRLRTGLNRGEPFTLLPWQAFVVGSLCGWKNSATGHRRFNKAYIETSTGNGCSTLVTVLGLYLLLTEKSPTPEIYSVAHTQEAAKEKHFEAVYAVNNSPLTASITCSVNRGLDGNGVFRSFSYGEPLRRIKPTTAIIYHCELFNRANLLTKLRKNLNQTQPLLLVTGRAGKAGSVAHQWHCLAKAVLASEQSDDGYFAFVCSLDEGDDPINDESCWEKANPSLGHTMVPEYLRRSIDNWRYGLIDRKVWWRFIAQRNFGRWDDELLNSPLYSPPYKLLNR
ncbi:hypothetical protein G3479_11345 [Shewanella baltica]|uniref:terminase large subunit domain-containing protein n=1 Tax=Shewanella baltica TaxID=62322 RepID=UPI00217DA022|nr:terminase large subunit [Shewanella baltica]MCS6259841.1 hypothetical protein [Shewanella baltica]